MSIFPLFTTWSEAISPAANRKNYAKKRPIKVKVGQGHSRACFVCETGAHLGLGVDVGPVVEQDLGHADLVLLSGQVQRREAALPGEAKTQSR